MKLLLGDSMDLLKNMEDNSVDSIVTDPPYGLSFMGKKWDYDVPSVEMWQECLRVLKPGGHLLSFAGSRTYHRMAVNIEDAGFEIRDQIMWVYGSGFPKSHNIGHKAEEWEGWGSALKPAHEPIVVARKPLIGTIVENVLEHGTGGLNIDESRVEYGTDGSIASNPLLRKKKGHSHKQSTDENSSNIKIKSEEGQFEANEKGRFPTNFIHDGSDEVVDLLGDKSRFFYCPKASTQERNAGCENIEPQEMGRNQSSLEGGKMLTGAGNERSNTKNNFHPTVKPVDLMRYLCRLVTPPNGIVLDPFMGSGTTGMAAKKEGFGFIGMEREGDYYDIASARIKNTLSKREWI